MLVLVSGTYSPNAYRGFAREFIKDLEAIRCGTAQPCSDWNHCISLKNCIWSCRPQAILDIIRSGERFRIDSTAKMPEQGLCEKCGYISSQVQGCSYLYANPKTRYISHCSYQCTIGTFRVASQEVNQAPVKTSTVACLNLVPISSPIDL